MKTKLLVTVLAALLLAGLAFGQSILGNMFQLGRSTEANFPASSSVIQGALLFDLDAGGPVYNDGVAWKALATGASGSYWYDGGLDPSSSFNTIQSTDAVQIKSTAGAGTFNVASKPYLTIVGPLASSTWGMRFQDSTGSVVTDLAYQTFGNGGDWLSGFNVITNGSVNFINPSGVGMGYFNTGASFQGYTSVAPVGKDGVRFRSAGARLHLSSSGTNDYFYSDGTNLGTHTSLGSDLSLTFGTSLTGFSVNAAGDNAGNFSTASAGVNSAGTMAYDQTFDKMMVRTSGTRQNKWQPIGQPNLIFDGQTFTTRIPHLASGPPALAERVSVTSSVDGGVDPYYRTYLGRAGGSSTLVLQATGFVAGAGNLGTYYGLSWTNPTENLNAYYLSVGVNEQVGAVVPFTLAPFINSDSSPGWCQKWGAPTDGLTLGGYRSWLGLTTAQPSGTNATGSFIMFRWESGPGATTVVGDGLLYLCTRDGATTSCTSTGVSPTALAPHILCFRYDTQNNAVYASVDGVHVVFKTTNLPAAATMLAPMALSERTIHTNPVDGGVLVSSMLLGNFQIETR